MAQTTGHSLPGQLPRNLLDLTSVAAPPADDRVHRSRHDLWILDGEVAADRVVVKRPDRRRLHDVESREVATGAAAIPDDHAVHRTGSLSAIRSNPGTYGPKR
jgi:hypothetical protein